MPIGMLDYSAIVIAPVSRTEVDVKLIRRVLAWYLVCRNVFNHPKQIIASALMKISPLAID
jgi:hypothetical protein